MLRVFVCEDNDLHREQINEIIKNYIECEALDMEVVLSVPNPGAVISYLSENPGKSGLYVLDVELSSDIDGLMLAEKIRKYDPRGFIIFVTVHGEALPLTFKYKAEALGFITKSDFQIGMRLCECIRDAYIKYTGKTTELNDNFVFKINHNLIALKRDEIIYFEASLDTAHKITVYTRNSVYNFYEKIKNLEKELGNGFFRCHKSYVVNLKKIKTINTATNTIYMENNSICFVSARQVSTLINLLKAS